MRALKKLVLSTHTHLFLCVRRVPRAASLATHHPWAGLLVCRAHPFQSIPSIVVVFFQLGERHEIRSHPIHPGAGTLARSTMATTRSLLLCAALLLAALSCTFAADAPFLVAHKKVALSRPKPGVERLAVSLDLYNQGSA